MRLWSFLIALLVTLSLPHESRSTCESDALDTTITCPGGSVRRVRTLAPDEPAYGGYLEEGCWSDSGSREGRFVIKDKSRYILATGRYVNGKKEGTWKIWTGNKIVREQWSKGHLDSDSTFGTHKAIGIDLCDCPPTGGRTRWLSIGSFEWRTSVAGPDSCRLVVWNQLEGAGSGPSTYLLPRSVGWLLIPSPNGELDLSQIRQHEVPGDARN